MAVQIKIVKGLYYPSRWSVSYIGLRVAKNKNQWMHLGNYRTKKLAKAGIDHWLDIHKESERKYL
jgi:hypothetical protein